MVIDLSKLRIPDFMGGEQAVQGASDLTNMMIPPQPQQEMDWLSKLAAISRGAMGTDPYAPISSRLGAGFQNLKAEQDMAQKQAMMNRQNRINMFMQTLPMFKPPQAQRTGRPKFNQYQVMSGESAGQTMWLDEDQFASLEPGVRNLLKPYKDTAASMPRFKQYEDPEGNVGWLSDADFASLDPQYRNTLMPFKQGEDKSRDPNYTQYMDAEGNIDWLTADEFANLSKDERNALTPYRAPKPGKEPGVPEYEHYMDDMGQGRWLTDAEFNQLPVEERDALVPFEAPKPKAEKTPKFKQYMDDTGQSRWLSDEEFAALDPAERNQLLPFEKQEVEIPGYTQYEYESGPLKGETVWHSDAEFANLPVETRNNLKEFKDRKPTPKKTPKMREYEFTDGPYKGQTTWISDENFATMPPASRDVLTLSTGKSKSAKAAKPKFKQYINMTDPNAQPQWISDADFNDMDPNDRNNLIPWKPTADGIGDVDMKRYEYESGDRKGEKIWLTDQQFNAMNAKERNLLKEFKAPDSRSYEKEKHEFLADMAEKEFNGEELTFQEKYKRSLIESSLNDKFIQSWSQHPDDPNLDVLSMERTPVYDFASAADQAAATKPETPKDYEEGVVPLPEPKRKDEAIALKNSVGDTVIVRKVRLGAEAKKIRDTAHSALDDLIKMTNRTFDKDGNWRDGMDWKLKLPLGGVFSSEVRDFKANMQAALAKILNTRTGAAFTQIEKDILEALLQPQIFDDADNFKHKLYTLMSEVNKRLEGYGVFHEFLTPDFKEWETSSFDPFGDIYETKPSARPGTVRPENQLPADLREWTDEELQYYGGQQ